MTITLNFSSGKLLISISLRSVSEIYFVLLFETFSSVSFSLTLCVGFCALEKTASSPSFLICVGNEFCQSAQTAHLVASQTFVIIQLALFVISGSQ